MGIKTIKIIVTVEIPIIKEIMEVTHVDNSKTLSQYPHKRITEPKLNVHGLPYLILFLVDYEVCIPYVPHFNKSKWVTELTRQFTSEFNMELKSQIQSINIY